MKRSAFKCPCCRADLYIRTSRDETPCFRNLWYQCSNVVCGATFNGHQAIGQQLSPSGIEKPLIQLPMAPAMERLKAQQAMRAEVETNQLDMLDAIEAVV